MSSRGNECNKSDAKKGVGRKKATGLNSIAFLQSNNDNATRELHRSPQFLTKTIREQLPTHGISMEDAFILAMAGKESIFHTFADDNSGSTISPWKVKSSSYLPNTKIPYHDIRDLSMAGDEHFYRDALKDAIDAAFVQQWGGTQADPPPGAKAICYHPAPDSVPGIGPHNDSGRIGSHMFRFCIEISEDSGELSMYAYSAVTATNDAGNDERGTDEAGTTDENKYTHGWIKSKPQEQLTKVKFPRPAGLSQYGMPQPMNGSGPLADHGDGTGVITHHAFHFHNRDHQRLLLVIDFRYISLERHNDAAEKAKTTPFSIYEFLSPEAKAQVDADMSAVVGSARSTASKNRRLLEYTYESVGGIRPTVADGQSLAMCSCGRVAITHGPEDVRVNGKYVLQRCYECREEDDLAHPCSGKCGRDSHYHTYCLNCCEYTCSVCKERLTYGGPRDTNPGQSYCKKCTSDYGSAHHKRKRAEATSATGREVSTSGRFLEHLPLDHNNIRLVVQAVCQSRPTPTSKVSWDEVMKKLRGWDFPSHFIKKQVKDAWLNKTGKPISVEVYKNSPQARANEEKGDWIAAVCGRCNGEQSMFFSHLAKTQKCRRCGKQNQRFTRKDETMDSTAGEGNEA